MAKQRVTRAINVTKNAGERSVGKQIFNAVGYRILTGTFSNLTLIIFIKPLKIKDIANAMFFK